MRSSVSFLFLIVTSCVPPTTTAPDAGDTRDAGAAGGRADAGVADAGRLDAGPGPSVADAGLVDGGPLDAGTITFDAGPGDGSFTVVTFNTGTGTTAGIDDDGDTWTSTEQGIGDEHYGNGLAFNEAIAGTRAFFEGLQPDVVAFQEIFDPGECANIPANFHVGFVCDGFTAGDATVAQRVLGDGYQVACNLGKPDKCLAVRTAFGSFRGCAQALCLDFLDGASIPNCGGGSRVGRGIIDLVGGGEITVVGVHGNSGASDDDIQCREDQADQIFDDFDGPPLANGERNIVLGDLNTDPGRAKLVDNSADRWEDYVNDNTPFHFVTDVGFFAEATYAGVANIDHVISDAFDGECRAAGITPGAGPVIPTAHFDHTAIICDVGL